jgi:hypothetical protein
MQCLLDELQIHVAPLLRGDGVRLFDQLGSGQLDLETTRVLHSPAVTHLRYRWSGNRRSCSFRHDA